MILNNENPHGQAADVHIPFKKMDSKLKKILIVGGTKYVGKMVVEKLLEQGHKVSVLSRGNIKPDWWYQIDHYEGDRNHLKDIKKLQAQKFDTIIDTQAFQKSHVESLINFFKKRFGHYIFISSTSSYNLGSAIFDPEYELKERDIELNRLASTTKGTPYAIGKRECEKYLVANESVSYTIFRPPKIFGPNDASGRIWWWIQRALDGRGFIIPDNFKNRFQFVFVNDFVDCILAAVHDRSSRNKIYNVANDEKFTMKDWMRSLSQATGNTSDFCFIPNDTIISTPGLETYQIPLYNYSPYLFDTHRIKEDLGIKFQPIENWLTQTIMWYKSKYHGKDSNGYKNRNQEVALYRKLCGLGSVAR